MNKINSYFAGLLAAAAAVVWNILYPTSGWQSIVIALLAAGSWFVPLRFMKYINIVCMALGVGIGAAGSVHLLSLTQPQIAVWQWWAAWILVSVVICYCGIAGLRGSATIVGIVLLLMLGLGFGFSVSMYDGSVQWTGYSFSRVMAGVVSVYGCSLAGTVAEDYKYVRLGAVSGCVLWALTAFCPLLVWGETAMQLMERPLQNTWQMITVLSSPDSLFCALVALAALWQSCAGLIRLKRLLYKKDML